MMSSEFNVTPVTSLTLDGLVPLLDHSLLFFVLFLAAYIFGGLSHLFAAKPSPADVRLRGGGSAELRGRQHGGLSQTSVRPAVEPRLRAGVPLGVSESGLRGVLSGQLQLHAAVGHGLRPLPVHLPPAALRRAGVSCRCCGAAAALLAASRRPGGRRGAAGQPSAALPLAA